MMSVGDEFWIMVLPLSQINNVDLRVSMENLVIWKVMKLEQTVIRMIRLLTLLLACAGDTELTFSFRIKMKEAKKISMRLPWWSKLIVCANGACGSCYTTRESNNSLKGWKRMSARTSTAKTWYIFQSSEDFYYAQRSLSWNYVTDFSIGRPTGDVLIGREMRTMFPTGSIDHRLGWFLVASVSASQLGVGWYAK